MNPLPTDRRGHEPPADDPWRTHRFETIGPCPVCGQPLRPGRGWVVRYRGQWVRLRCGDCAAAFDRDPGRYGAGSRGA